MFWSIKLASQPRLLYMALVLFGYFNDCGSFRSLYGSAYIKANIGTLSKFEEAMEVHRISIQTDCDFRL